MRRQYRFVFLGLLLASCAPAVNWQPAAPSEVQFAQEDDPGARVVRFEFVSRSARDLCISADNWPWQGVLSFGSDQAAITVGGVEYRMTDVNLGHCLDLETNGRACEMRLKPGERLASYLSYEAFALPETVGDQPKQLRYDLSFYAC